MKSLIVITSQGSTAEFMAEITAARGMVLPDGPTHCIRCGAFLQMGKTLHRPDCPIGQLSKQWHGLMTKPRGETFRNRLRATGEKLRIEVAMLPDDLRWEYIMHMLMDYGAELQLRVTESPNGWQQFAKAKTQKVPVKRRKK